MTDERSWIQTLEQGAFGETRADADAAAAPETLASVMAEVSRYLYLAEDASDACDRVLEACTKIVEGCSHAAVSLTSKGRVTTPAASDRTAEQLDELQHEMDEGPCLQAIRDDRNFSVPDLAGDPRWPRYGPEAARRGVRSMVSCRLFIDSRTIGALNVFGPVVDAFDESDQDRIVVLAAHAAVAIDAARTRSGLQEAVRSRQVIGEAIGILKERYSISSDTAFERLTRASQHLNVKLRSIAEHLSREPEERDAG
ncbi:hypothetical protein Ae168Ps1_1775c [Pseudonocardia sp. Ae168_Ps1]|uniref:GAF and ANTAR domain-containing protein n=1 Tax=unclassified Pseudonocardia TaxID=2619320 RepID=UPI00095AC253|nr:MULTISPECIES: GAF and ANTAR domain-containing protein [unclassified Pseudonocardia]OLL73393.1 hypothetical protein Ae150APs1_1771c [Pseudonocardia sp. Ae150A_Ps1]OLL79369.1 hypothetical protein Ae168Ps1_1775c [Pseudonocardia sp. Ae168_Ps1]OLL86496.1 hypothetical protein Ae263Ps1_3551 [Pseudonocardia sp. Ae263_Ps1]OLL93455.1 hypothetical protein Ae356Ps1_3352c [Pseudonocardia sp. Ae356_Ps1]